ncbi:MAG: Smr/MutS family protein [Nitrospiraceae bacterium]|nr:Smr/MutS family protein [Nitrospiraceae bacterium]
MKMKTPSLHFTPFEALKDLKTSPGSKAPAPPAPKAAKNTDARGKSVRESEKSDHELFLEAMKGVREIKEFKEASGPARPKPRAPRKGDSRREEDVVINHLSMLVRGREPITLSQTGEYIEWTGPGTNPGIARRLHSGEFTVGEYIDLHGMTREKAFDALRFFLQEARRKRTFCVKVIHGRGLRSPAGPVLKEAMIKWLQGPFRKYVRAYSSARACDGGPGATYIILKSG